MRTSVHHYQFTHILLTALRCQAITSKLEVREANLGAFTRQLPHIKASAS